ncbi:lysylphosphatidylglycerol synthase transmembrane domain-containing protein [Wenyingzhuangia sp. IMCC45533]
MKASTKKILKTIIPLGIGFFLIWLSLSKFTSEDFKTMRSSFVNANYWWVSLSVLIAIASHLSRAYRWKYMLATLGYKPAFYNKAFAVFISYFVNMGIPRAGEVARATTINQYEGIPIDKAFGTIVAERLADMAMYLIIIALGFIAQYSLISEVVFSKIPNDPWIVLGVLSITAIIVFIMLKAIQKSNIPSFVKVRQFLVGLWQGIKTIFTMKNKWAFIAHTVFIWLCYILMLYVVTFAFPETTHLGMNAVLVCFILGTFAFATTNSGIGVYPLVIQKALLIYGIQETIGASFGWIMWSAQIFIILILGVLSFILLPIFKKSR